LEETDSLTHPNENVWVALYEGDSKVIGATQPWVNTLVGRYKEEHSNKLVLEEKKSVPGFIVYVAVNVLDHDKYDEVSRIPIVLKKDGSYDYSVISEPLLTINELKNSIRKHRIGNIAMEDNITIVQVPSIEPEDV